MDLNVSIKDWLLPDINEIVCCEGTKFISCKGIFEQYHDYQWRQCELIWSLWLCILLNSIV